MKVLPLALIVVAIAGVGMAWSTTWEKIRDNDKAKAQAETTVITQERTVGTFTSIKATDAMHVVYTQGSPASVSVTTEKQHLKLVKTDVKEGCLRLSCSNHGTTDHQNLAVTVKITAPAVREFELRGATSLVAEGPIDLVGAVDIEARGASSVEIANIKCGTLDLGASGAATINLGAVSASTLKVDASGSSHVRANAGSTRQLEIEASSASRVNMARVNAQMATAEASGASRIDYNAAYGQDNGSSESAAATVRNHYRR